MNNSNEPPASLIPQDKEIDSYFLTMRTSNLEIPPGSISNLEIASLKQTPNCLLLKQKIMTVSEFLALKASNTDHLLIDIREAYEYEFENMGGFHMPLGEVLDRLEEIPHNKTVVIHCQSGMRAGKLVTVLQSMGYTNVYNLEGGFEAFKELHIN